MKTINLIPLLDATRKAYAADYSTPYDMPLDTKEKGKWTPFLNGVPFACEGQVYKHNGKTYLIAGGYRAETTPIVRKVLGLE